MSHYTDLIENLRRAVYSGVASGEFPSSLLRQYDNGRPLSAKQWYWVERLAAPRPVEQLPSFAGVLDLFARAREHLKYPKIALLVGEQPVRLHVAGPRSRHAGSVQITDGTGFGGLYFGRVDPNGQATLSEKNLPPPAKQALVNLLTALAERPAEVAAHYGKLTGNCCFCSRALSDARSTVVGYGPVCAEHYGLPWGAQEVAA